MDSDKERRDVVARLREWLAIPWYKRPFSRDAMQTLGEMVGAVPGENIVERIADLIDRPTCETIEHGRPDESNVCKSCSRCSYGWFECTHDKPYSYCPNCGAVVTEKEE